MPCASICACKGGKPHRSGKVTVLNQEPRWMQQSSWKMQVAASGSMGMFQPQETSSAMRAVVAKTLAVRLCDAMEQEAIKDLQAGQQPHRLDLPNVVQALAGGQAAVGLCSIPSMSNVQPRCWLRTGACRGEAMPLSQKLSTGLQIAATLCSTLHMTSEPAASTSPGSVPELPAFGSCLWGPGHTAQPELQH